MGWPNEILLNKIHKYYLVKKSTKREGRGVKNLSTWFMDGSIVKVAYRGY